MSEKVHQRKIAENASNNGGGWQCSPLGAAPEAVNVVGGGTRDAPRLWHEVSLDDLSGLLPSEYTAGEQIVPLLVSSNREEAECYSAYAAQQGLFIG